MGELQVQNRQWTGKELYQVGAWDSPLMKTNLPTSPLQKCPLPCTMLFITLKVDFTE